MNVLVVGKGGREHAIARSLVKSQSVSQVFSQPGNQGMEPEVTLVKASMNSSDVLETVRSNNIDLVIIGPEDPLVDGLASELRTQSVTVFGPDRQGAQLEGSKIFSKRFMEKYHIPSAPFCEVTSVDDVRENLTRFTPPYVLKADGLAAGKGVFICDSEEDLIEAAENLFEKKILGEAGKTALLEQFQPGFELSYFVLTNGKDYVSLPMAQDHKKLLDKDKGPNTGGMGTVAPMAIDSSLHQAIIDQVVTPTVHGLNEEAFDYRGVVFIGLMVTEKGPQVLEYNVRFGDPETQVLLPLLDGDWGQAFLQVAKGEIPQLKWKDSSAACVVMAAEGYPDHPKKGVAIQGDWSGSEDQYFLHAGTLKDDTWKTNGGRVLNAVGEAKTMAEAIEKAYQQSQKVSWPGMQVRRDIGQKANQV